MNLSSKQKKCSEIFVNASLSPRLKKVKEAKLPPFVRARDLSRILGINLKDITRRISAEGYLLHSSLWHRCCHLHLKRRVFMFLNSLLCYGSRLRFKSVKDIIFSWEATSRFASSIGITPIYDDPDLSRDPNYNREKRKHEGKDMANKQGMVQRPGNVLLSHTHANWY